MNTALAKKEVFGEVGIDMFAGPSEVTIIADKYSNPDWIAADLIAQAEHDAMSQSILITDDKKIIMKVKKALGSQIKFLPKKNSYEKFKKIWSSCFSKKFNEISNIANKIAPEHLEILTSKLQKYLKNINNAGSIFLGKYSPEAIGDYLAGPNHVLLLQAQPNFHRVYPHMTF